MKTFSSLKTKGAVHASYNQLHSYRVRTSECDVAIRDSPLSIIMVNQRLSRPVVGGGGRSSRGSVGGGGGAGQRCLNCGFGLGQFGVEYSDEYCSLDCFTSAKVSFIFKSMLWMPRLGATHSVYLEGVLGLEGSTRRHIRRLVPPLPLLVERCDAY